MKSAPEKGLKFFSEVSHRALLNLEQPSGYQLPRKTELLIEGPVMWLMAFNEAPEFLGVVHVDRMAKLMDQHVPHEFGRQKQQLRVQC